MRTMLLCDRQKWGTPFAQSGRGSPPPGVVAMFRGIIQLIAAMSVAPFALAADADLDDVAQKIIERTNRFRQDQKRDPLTTNEQLTATARDFAAWMAKNGKFAHDADGKQPWDRAKA